MDPVRRATLHQQTAALATLENLRSGQKLSLQDEEVLREMAKDINECLPTVDEELQQIQADIQYLEGMLGRLRGRAVALSDEKIRMEDQSALCEASIAPIRRVPVEIMGQIFEQVVTSATEHGLGVPTDLHSLTTTCYAWRMLALSTPSLWSTIRMDSGSYLGELSRRQSAAFVRAQLRWSGDAPLHLSVLVASITRGDDQFDEAWRGVCSQSHRWKTVIVNAAGTNSTFWQDNPCFTNLPALVDLKIWMDERDTQFPVVFDSPKLRRIEIDHSVLNFARQSHFPLSRPSTLVLTGIPLADCLSAMQWFSSTLESLRVDLSRLTLAQRQAFKPELIVLPILKKLHISGDGALRYICRSITAPSVRHLDIDRLDEHFDGGEDIVQMINRSSAAIETLVVQRCTDIEDRLLDLLEGLPTVTELQLDAEIGRSHLNEKLFLGLTPSAENSPCLLPNLRRISAAVSAVKAHGDVSFAKVLQMMEELRKEDCVVDGRLYPAVKERLVTRQPWDITFDNSDSETNDSNTRGGADDEESNDSDYIECETDDVDYTTDSGCSD